MVWLKFSGSRCLGLPEGYHVNNALLCHIYIMYNTTGINLIHNPLIPLPILEKALIRNLGSRNDILAKPIAPDINLDTRIARRVRPGNLDARGQLPTRTTVDLDLLHNQISITSPITTQCQGYSHSTQHKTAHPPHSQRCATQSPPPLPDNPPRESCRES